MGSSKVKTVDMSMPVDEPKKKSATTEETVSGEVEIKKEPKGRSKNYKQVRGMVDKTKLYSLDQAIELLKRVTYSKFAGTVTVDATVVDEKLNIETSFPHSTGKTVTVAIADDKIIKKIEDGNIDFDVLIATPDMMPKIAKHARVLGPRGLMPSPKNKTVTDDPKARQKELEAGRVSIKVERKFPLIHVTVGKSDQAEKELKANITHLIKTVGPRKFKKLAIASTMSPGIKVDISEFIEA